MGSATSYDLAGMTLVVKDLQFGASTPGVGATGISLSSQTFTTETLTGVQLVQASTVTATSASATAGILMGADQFGIYFGTATPSGQLAATTGSIYLNKGGSGPSTRVYVNTGGSSWTFVTTGA